jgi:hypothetical protein
MSDNPFTPLRDGVAISASTTSANAAVAQPSDIEFTIRAVNLSSAIAYIAVGSSGVTATAANAAVAPNSAAHIRVGAGRQGTHVAALLTTGTGTVHVQAVKAD